jgi:hypothetical protein
MYMIHRLSAVYKAMSLHQWLIDAMFLATIISFQREISWDSSVGIAIGYGMDYRVSNPFSTAATGPHSLLSNGNRGFSP